MHWQAGRQIGTTSPTFAPTPTLAPTLAPTRALALTLTLAAAGCSNDTEPPADLEKLTAEMSQRVVATTEYERQGTLIARYNQPKTVACLSGEFNVSGQIPDKLKHGLFAKAATYPVTARFANASKWDDSEKDLRGMSLQVGDVPGEPLWGKTGYQDFLLNSHPALFVATPEDFLGFMRARQSGSKLSLAKFFLNPFDPQLKSLITVLKARKKHLSPLDIRYWSTVPSALDSTLTDDDSDTSQSQAVKYSLTPCSEYTTGTDIVKGENQLRSAIKTHLSQADACFDFGVQMQTDPQQMPIEDASVIWDEQVSPFINVARITFSNQNFDEPEQLASCERTQFNPWQSLPAHTPLGRMNAVRKAVYTSGAKQRTQP